MKRTSKKLQSSPAQQPTPDQIRQYIDKMAEEHDQAWQQELMDAAPHWVYLLGLHLRMVELAQLSPAAEELL